MSELFDEINEFLNDAGNDDMPILDEKEAIETVFELMDEQKIKEIGIKAFHRARFAIILAMTVLHLYLEMENIPDKKANKASLDILKAAMKNFESKYHVKIEKF